MNMTAADIQAKATFGCFKKENGQNGRRCTTIDGEGTKEGLRGSQCRRTANVMALRKFRPLKFFREAGRCSGTVHTSRQQVQDEQRM